MDEFCLFMPVLCLLHYCPLPRFFEEVGNSQVLLMISENMPVLCLLHHCPLLRFFEEVGNSRVLLMISENGVILLFILYILNE